MPIASKIVPRPAGSTTGIRVCAVASRDSDAARTVWIHAARASSPANATMISSNRKRIRELTTRVMGYLAVPRLT